MYAALENNMDYILFLDDHEYPVAVTKNKKACLWGGQYVLPMHLLDGVLPLHLEPISLKNKEAVTRFYKACIGWIHYKPLFVYITNQDKFTEIMSQIKAELEETLPMICQYFERDKFQELLPEFNKYSKNVVKHSKQFQDTQAAWGKLLGERKYWHKV